MNKTRLGLTIAATLSMLITGSNFSNLAIAQEQDFSDMTIQIRKTIQVQVEDKNYPLKYDMSNGGSIDNVSAEPYLTMVMEITSPSNGTLDPTFSRELYDALSFTEHYDPLAVLDGVFVDEPVLIDSSCEETTLTIPVYADTRKVELLYSDILMEHSHSYPEKIDLLKTIEEEGQKFSVRIVTDAKKCDVTFLKEQKKFHIDIEGRKEATGPEQGYFRLTVPHDLLGGNYTVFVDGGHVNFTQDTFFYPNYDEIYVEAIFDESTRLKANHLTFNYSKEATAIDIVGTTAIPEFGSSLIIAIIGIVAIVGAVVVSGRTVWRRGNKDKKTK